ncbi:diaminobutyrate acetyltransferase [Paenibacillus puerhi]|uniref:diaminobutyrate acetyltransferase n=1 Tax=Paenibacillus puerhi TaxID=2692622 RepID=UPI0013576437|nr:diaminobutyrate acetyltransferase [Paenibacillus puerhi]
MQSTAVRFRTPAPEDGAGVWELVQEAGTLELNSAYAYILLCDYFKETCLVAEGERGIAGFVAGFRPPGKPDTLLVWQIAVAPSARRRGLGRMLLKELLGSEPCRDIRYVEATISPSNLASRGLFIRLAQEYRSELKLSSGYPASLFPAQSGHEEEVLFTIGPLPVHKS